MHAGVANAGRANTIGGGGARRPVPDRAGPRCPGNARAHQRPAGGQHQQQICSRALRIDGETGPGWLAAPAGELIVGRRDEKQKSARATFKFHLLLARESSPLACAPIRTGRLFISLEFMRAPSLVPANEPHSNGGAGAASCVRPRACLINQGRGSRAPGSAAPGRINLARLTNGNINGWLARTQGRPLKEKDKPAAS